jgi:hypothetical protein
MAITHDSLAVNAFKVAYGRAPKRSVNLRSADEAWIQQWKADHLKRLCREDPDYARYYAMRRTWRSSRTAKLRLEAATRTPSSR